VDADLVTPGLWGFLLLFFLALAVYLLGRSMARRVRGVNQRARLEAEAEAEQQAAESEAAAVQRARSHTQDPGAPPQD
jgi:Na+-transporting methylmalonyl-CoA/oxaloacetate decarboxylase gamma subunit